MILRRFALLFVAILSLSTISPAQRADVSFVAGGAFASDSTITNSVLCITAPCSNSFTFSTNHHVFFEGTPAFRLANFKVAALYLEVPVAGVPSAPLRFNRVVTNEKLSSIFVTPSLRFKLAPASPISPFVSIGGGWAHYSFSNGDINNENGALQFGGGVDIKTGIPLLGFRAEVRDFVTGQPDFGVFSITTVGAPPNNDRRHNVLAGGGIVLRF